MKKDWVVGFIDCVRWKRLELFPKNRLLLLIESKVWLVNGTCSFGFIDFYCKSSASPSPNNNFRFSIFLFSIFCFYIFYFSYSEFSILSTRFKSWLPKDILFSCKFVPALPLLNEPRFSLGFKIFIGWKDDLEVEMFCNWFEFWFPENCVYSDFMGWIF